MPNQTHRSTKPQRERRSVMPHFMPTEFRVVDANKREAEAIVCVYNVVDDYGTIWLPGCWTDSLERKLPKMVWGHDWLDIIGRAIDFTDSEQNLKLLFKLSEFDAVPRAKQAWTQLRDGDVDEFSFGFDRHEWISLDSEDDQTPDGAREKIVRATMYEGSPVLVGAVPGTKPISVRAIDSNGTIAAQDAATIATRLAAGDIDLVTALTEMKDAATDAPATPAPDADKPAADAPDPDAPATPAPDADKPAADAPDPDATAADIDAEALDGEMAAALALTTQ